MADKTTTLKTKTNDNVYPNIIGDNRDNAISDSAHINHTLTAEHKINFRLDTNVSGLIFNSLQKPAGLTKTELVGVGTNGQENIEIGDNLTLANGKLSATGGGSGGEAFDVITLSEDGKKYTGTITGTKPIVMRLQPLPGAYQCFLDQQAYTIYEGNIICSAFELGYGTITTYSFSNGNVTTLTESLYYTHFITMTD